MAKDQLVKTFEEVFSFLSDEFEFKTIKSNSEDWGYCFTAVNNTTGVEIIYEIGDAYVNIILYKLVNGEIVDNTYKAIRNNEQINGFNLDLVVRNKNPNDLIRPAYEYGKDSEFYKPGVGLKNYITVFADNLRKYGSEVLKGDFTVFNKLDKILKEK